jgi:8-oxo-dGTP diphosphatase
MMSNYPVIDSVGIVVFDKDQVLLVRHGVASNYSNKICGIPAGKIERGERDIESAKRELEEETGLKCQISDLISLPKFYQAQIEQKDGIKIFNWYVFLCKNYSGELKSSEETEPFWVNIKDLGNFKLLPNVKEAISSAKLIK